MRGCLTKGLDKFNAELVNVLYPVGRCQKNEKHSSTMCCAVKDGLFLEG